MARHIDPNETAEEIIRGIEKHAGGATIEQVVAAIKVPRRTVQRRLADLVASGRLRAVGRGKLRRYQLAAIAEARLPLFDQLLAKATEIADPFEQAFFAMVHLPYLQPFADVNKRVSRLAANIPFIKHNLAPLSFVDVPERDYIDGLLGVYELQRVDLLRDVFAWAYDRDVGGPAVGSMTSPLPGWRTSASG